jgi:hypothetical protein
MFLLCLLMRTRRGVSLVRAERGPPRAKMVQLECTALQRLPAGRTTDYDEATV